MEWLNPNPASLPISMPTFKGGEVTSLGFGLPNVSIEPVKVKYGPGWVTACAGMASKRDIMTKTRILQKINFCLSLEFGFFIRLNFCGWVIYLKVVNLKG